MRVQGRRQGQIQVKREPFASAAGLKWRRYRALALLAAGFAPDLASGVHGSRQVAQAIAGRLSNDEGPLPWRIDDFERRGATVGALDRAWFESSIAGVPLSRRSVALRSSEAVDAVDAWLFFTREDEAKDLRDEGWSFWVSARARDLDLPTSPPLVIGYFANTTAEQVATLLDEDGDLHPAFEVAALTREAPSCDFQIMVDRDVATATEHAMRASAAVGGSSCGLCVVLLKEGLPERARTRELLELRDALGAAGLLVGKGDAAAAGKLTHEMLGAITEQQPLWPQRFRTQGGRALLLCDERLAMHVITTWTRQPVAVGGGGGGVAPGVSAPGRRMFPFLPSSKELRRDGGSGPGGGDGGSRPIRSGPRRRQGGKAPFAPGQRRAADSFGKTEGAPTGSGGASWMPPSHDRVAESGEPDETPGKAPSGGASSAPLGPLPQVMMREPIEVPPGPPPQPEEPARDVVPAAEPAASTFTDAGDAVITLGELDGEPTLVATGEADDAGVAFPLGDEVVATLRTAFDGAMTDIASDPSRYEGLKAPGTADLLRGLARSGAALREALSVEAGLPSRPTRVQVVSTTLGVTVPIEFLYALEPPDENAPLCERAEEELRSERSELADGWCPGCSPGSKSADEQRRTVCPLAFWGIACSIERRYEAAPDDEDEDVPRRAAAGHGVLHPLRCAIVGVTDRVTTEVTEAFTEAVSGSAQTLLEAEDWSDWAYYIEREPTPTLLAMLGHTKLDARYKTPQLEFGTASTLDIAALKLTHVRPSEDTPPPVAILMGAGAGLTDAALESFAAAFQAMGSVVVSTIASVPLHQLTALVAEVVAAIARAQGPVPVPELMIAARRKALVDGTPAALSLVALAEGDWSVEGH